jgi:hypothetical protein
MPDRQLSCKLKPMNGLVARHYALSFWMFLVTGVFSLIIGEGMVGALISAAFIAIVILFICRDQPSFPG